MIGFYVEVKEIAAKHDNYVPLYILREALPSLDRAAFDKLVYELDRLDKVELSALADPQYYTQEQIACAIESPVGRHPLMFLTITED